MRVCSIDGCGKRHHGAGFCNTHFAVFKRNGDALSARPKRKDGEGSIRRGYISHNSGGIRKDEHILVAERARGKVLPVGAEVHHWNGVKADNAPSNLVVCPNHGYHRLLHYRQRALSESGHADWKYCSFCGLFDDPENMYMYARKNVAFHRVCSAKYARDRRATKEARP